MIILAPRASNLLEISSFIIRVIVRRVTTVVIPMVRPRVRKKTFPFRRRRLEMDISFSLIGSIHFETEIAEQGQVILYASTRGGEIIPDDHGSLSIVHCSS